MFECVLFVIFVFLLLLCSLSLFNSFSNVNVSKELSKSLSKSLPFSNQLSLLPFLLLFLPFLLPSLPFLLPLIPKFMPLLLSLAGLLSEVLLLEGLLSKLFSELSS